MLTEQNVMLMHGPGLLRNVAHPLDPYSTESNRNNRNRAAIEFDNNSSRSLEEEEGDENGDDSMSNNNINSESDDVDSMMDDDEMDDVDMDANDVTTDAGIGIGIGTGGSNVLERINEFIRDTHILSERSSSQKGGGGDAGDRDRSLLLLDEEDETGHRVFIVSKTPCHLCGKTSESLIEHMGACHPEHTCQRCEQYATAERIYKSCENEPMEDYMLIRVNAQGKIKLHKCKQCKSEFQRKGDYWIHLRVHIKPEKLLICQLCPFGTEYKHHLEYHIRNHTGNKPFKCSRCSYTCVNKSMLNSHKKSHSNVYQYRCANCTYATKYCHSLKLHLRKYKHLPAQVLNSDGTVNPLPIIDIYGTKRGPRSMKTAKNHPHLNPNLQNNTNATTLSPGGVISQASSPQLTQPHHPPIVMSPPNSSAFSLGAAAVNQLLTPPPPQFGGLFEGPLSRLYSCNECDYRTPVLGVYHRHLMAHNMLKEFGSACYPENLPFLQQSPFLPHLLPPHSTPSPPRVTPPHQHQQTPPKSPPIPQQDHSSNNRNVISVIQTSSANSSPNNSGSNKGMMSATSTPPPPQPIIRSSSPPLDLSGGRNNLGGGGGETRPSQHRNRRKGPARKIEKICMKLQQTSSASSPDSSTGSSDDRKVLSPLNIKVEGGEEDHKSEMTPAIIETKIGVQHHCFHCNITYGDTMMYVMHMGLHDAQNPFRCNGCGNEYQDPRSYNFHIVSVSHESHFGKVN